MREQDGGKNDSSEEDIKCPCVKQVKIQLETYMGNPFRVIGAALARVNKSSKDVNCLSLWLKGTIQAYQGKAAWKRYIYYGGKSNSDIKPTIAILKDRKINLYSMC